MASWSFLTNHARTLLCIAHDPGVRFRDIAVEVGITERSAHGIVAEWTCRYLGGAYTWVVTEPAALACIGHGAPHELRDAPNAPGLSTAEVRACARANDIRVADRGRLRPDIWEAWHAADRAR